MNLKVMLRKSNGGWVTDKTLEAAMKAEQAGDGTKVNAGCGAAAEQWLGIVRLAVYAK